MRDKERRDVPLQKEWCGVGWGGLSSLRPTVGQGAQRRVGTACLEGMRASHVLGGEETSWGRRCQEADF